jgi:hypothetical protein
MIWVTTTSLFRGHCCTAVSTSTEVPAIHKGMDAVGARSVTLLVATTGCMDHTSLV